jgi:hypothetical protein
MLIKNYLSQNHESPCLDCQIIDGCEDVVIYANFFNRGEIGDLNVASVVSVIDQGDCLWEEDRFCRHIDFTKNSVRTRLIVKNHAYVCNDQGKTIEKVSC